MFLPATCPACGRRGEAPCAACRAHLTVAPELGLPQGVDSLRALFAYDDAGRALVAALKYRNDRGIVPWLAASLAALATVEPPPCPPPRLVTWVPTTAARRRGRGYDQSALLARRVARHLRLPLRSTLGRAPGPPQTGSPLPLRLTGPRFVARVAVGGAVLLIDDVVTTGSSVAAAAAVLRRSGATRVDVLAVARTPVLRRPPFGAATSVSTPTDAGGAPWTSR